MPCVYVEHRKTKQSQPVVKPTQPVVKPTKKQTGVPETQLIEFAVGAAIVGGALYFLLKR